MGSDVSTDKGNDEKDSPPLEKSDGMMELKVVLKKKVRL